MEVLNSSKKGKIRSPNTDKVNEVVNILRHKSFNEHTFVAVSMESDGPWSLNCGTLFRHKCLARFNCEIVARMVEIYYVKLQYVPRRERLPGEMVRSAHRFSTKGINFANALNFVEMVA